MRSLFNTLANTFFIERCVGCGARSQAAFCASCDIRVLRTGGGCTGCGVVQDGVKLCGRCTISGAPFDNVSWSYEYGGAVADAIAALKFRDATWTARRLVEDRDGCLASWDVIVPVPLHPKRLRLRGYNQSALLAHYIARRGRRRIDYTSLVRSRDTHPQRELSEIGRVTNVHGAFAVRFADGLRGQSVLLVDDVMTTGATLRECGRLLRRAGVERVGAYVVARRS